MIKSCKEKVDKLTVCYTEKGYKSKPQQKGFYGKVKVEEVFYNEFIELIKSGHSFKQVPNIAALQNNVELITKNGKNAQINAANIRKGNVTMNMLQRKIVMQFCKFQTIFFDIDYCDIDHAQLISKIALKPNLIYETFSHSANKHRYRLVHVLDSLIDTGYYRAVYLAFKEYVKDIVEDDKCAENPTQTIYGTCNNVYRVHDCYYSVDTSKLDFIFYGDIELKQYTKCIVEENFYNYCMSHSIADFLKEYSANNRTYQEVIVDWNLKEHIITKTDNEYKCIEIEYETPNNIIEKFVSNKEGLLALPHYVGNGKKLVVNDGRKKYIEKIAHLLLLMNKDIVIEDLIYNVFRWVNMHISFNKKKNDNILNGKLILEKCIACFDNFKNNKSINYLGYLNRLRQEFVSKIKKAPNPYYYALHYQNNTFFYWHNFQLIDSAFTSKPDISLTDLKKELAKIKVERNKNVQCRSDKGKKRNTYIGSKKNEVIKMLQRGFSNKEIAAQLQVSSQYVSKIKAELSSNV
ncbi:hypothetical protein QR305_01001 [Bacteroides finegoldii]|mgnify:CR=1 FL=1|uniref:Uncharacterized protein n=1 Tax=Bacteroides finegoldii CL09T03C10 TaxID=997888 RepID=K5C9D3_9BACE|nr:response regulator transcription factor [Bacteroides finegoldii]EKJ89319.1 hypothetical protein HMPREF1057_04072 [Bacteroides finegoldii CL09T03C10]